MCLNFYKWINAIAECYQLKKDTRPLLNELEIQKKTLAEAQGKLDKQLAALKIIQDAVQKLENDFDSTKKKIEHLKLSIKVNEE